MKYLIIFFYSCLSLGKITGFQTIEREVKSYSWEEVCSYFLKTKIPIIERHSSIKINCMGQILAVEPFCGQKFIDHPRYLHGQINKINKTVDCVFAKKVILEALCENCLNPKKDCQKRRDKMAKNLITADHILSEKKLICTFHSSL